MGYVDFLWECWDKGVGIGPLADWEPNANHLVATVLKIDNNITS